MYKFLSIIILLSFFVSCDNKADKKEESNLSELEEISQKIAENNANDKLYYERAQIYNSKDSLDLAIIDMQKAIEYNHTNIDYYIYMADIFFKSGQLKNTLNTLQKASVVDPENVELLLKTSEIYLTYQKYKETFKFANMALEQDPTNSKAYFIKGFAHKELGDTAEAVKNYEKATLYDPDSYFPNIELGLIYASRHNGLAEKYYKNAIRIDSTNPNGYYNLAMFYQNHMMENKALETYRELLKHDPDNQHAYFNIGYILLENLNIPQEAIPYFQQAIKIKNDYYQAYYNIGLCYEYVGDIENARINYKEALNLKTNYNLAIEGLNRIDEGNTVNLQASE